MSTRTVSLMEGGARLVELAEQARMRLEEDGAGAGPAIGEAMAQLRRGPDDLPEIAEALEALEGASELVREASAKVERVLDSADVDPLVFERSQERLAMLQDLMRKYGRTEPELVRLRDRLAAQLDQLEAADGVPADLAAEEERARARVPPGGRS